MGLGKATKKKRPREPRCPALWYLPIRKFVTAVLPLIGLINGFNFVTLCRNRVKARHDSWYRGDEYPGYNTWLAYVGDINEDIV